MAIIKSYTSVEQSRMLAEILPIESADMWWSRCAITDFGDGVLKVSYAVEPCNISQFRNTKEDVPCWSLVALLSVLPKSLINTPNPTLDGYCCKNIMHDLETYGDNPIDACYEMIIKLHELNLL